MLPALSTCTFRKVDAGTIEVVRSLGVEIGVVRRPDPAVRGHMGRRPVADAPAAAEASTTSAYDLAWR